MKSIALCGSITAYESVIKVMHELKNRGYTAHVPALALKMEAKQNYLLVNETFEEKHQATLNHFTTISVCDAVLVINQPKHGFQGYIGPAVLMEMAVAFYLKKPIFILNDPDPRMSNQNEIQVLKPICLNGDLLKINF